MARYQKALDIWPLSPEERAGLAIGQWVFAGEPENKGRFYGEGRASTVVAWLGNAKGKRGNYRAYMAAIRDYGRSVRPN
jgi:hypothetical protein